MTGLEFTGFRCSICGYDLRGLTHHACPECGERFDPERWHGDRDPAPNRAQLSAVALFVFPIVGVIAMAFSIRANRCNRIGDFTRADYCSDRARLFSIVSYVVGIVVWIDFVILPVVMSVMVN